MERRFMSNLLSDPAWATLATAEISDALDFLRLPGCALGVHRVAGPAAIVGPAYTVRFAPVDPDRKGTVGDYIDDVPEGAVIVLDNAGLPDCTVWGGILSRLARHKRIAGTVIHGVCRDIAEAEACGYPLYSRGHTMRTGKDRVQVEAVQVPVSLGHVRVCPGDLITADADGVVVVPQARAGDVLRKALATQAAEARILADVLAGSTIADARRRHGYHTLQRGDDA
ncbi:Demethylmenaquinone methyltransferase [plant metagenome]|uniref:Demethylmenaquinone methyltransferase n=2 Tax=plant metagenome TaxID=1297885 RepID=A0A484TQE5_9ZZZZ